MNTSWLQQLAIVVVPFFTAVLAFITATARIRAAREKPKKHPTLNGYAPLFADLLDRLEHYRREYEAQRVVIATLRERLDSYDRRRTATKQKDAASASALTETPTGTTKTTGTGQTRSRRTSRTPAPDDAPQKK